MNKNNPKWLAMAVGCALAVPVANAAQLEEVMVTAQKRVESMQDVPISVSAISGEQLTTSVVLDVFDLRSVVPSLEIRAVDPPSQGTSFAIRGLGTSVFNMGFEPTVATFVDGVYRARSGIITGSDFVDMSRIEVLKGPQGSLFGKNSTGGVVALHSNQPELGETSGEISLSYEEYETIRARGFINVPLGDSAALRVAGSYADGDGWLDNVVTGNEIHDRDRWYLRAQLLFQPTDNFSLRIIGDYAELEEMCCTPLRYENDPNTGAVNGPIAGSIGSTIIDPANIDDLKVALNTDPMLEATDQGLSAEINWTFGGVTLTSISAWREYEDKNYKDNDFTGVDVLYSNQDLPEVSMVSQELRLAGSFDSVMNGFDWTVGAYYASEDIKLLNEFIWGSQGVIFSNVKAYSASFDHSGDTTAVFAHGTLGLTERLSLTAGIRYTKDEKDATLVNDHPLAPVPFPPFSIPSVFPLPVVHDYTASTDDSATTGTLSVQYEFAEEIMGYASFSTGFKSGGISLTRDAAGPFLGFTPAGPIGPFPPGDPTFDKETADSFEVGVKSVTLDGALRLNAAAWVTTFDDLQVQVLNPQGNFVVTNVEGAESTGIELEGEYAATDYLRFTGAVQFVDAQYDDDVGGLTTPIPVGGTDLPYVSDTTASLGFSYDAPMGQALRFFLSGNLFYRSDYEANADTAFGYVADGFTQFNARVGVGGQSDAWDVALWCKNCGDEQAIQSRFQIPFDGAIFFPSTSWSHINTPRVWGVTGTYRF